MSQIPADIASLNDYQRYAKDRLPPASWAYIHGASADEITAAKNETAFANIPLLNQVLTDVSRGSTQTRFLGQTLEHPIILAPVAYQKLAHPEGEIASAMAAAAQGGLFCLSTLASSSIEEVSEKTSGPKWFQLYFQNTEAKTRELIQRAEQSGYQAIMVTVDAPINGLRNREQRANFSLPNGVRAVNTEPDHGGVNPLEAGQSLVFQGLMKQAPTWDKIRWLKDQTSLPIIIKGIINPKDAAKACAIGVDAIVVSNHGGRTLDTLPASIDMLPEIRAVVGDLPLILDSGIRRGTDIVKALALGANAIMIGRPIFYGLATAGALGVAHTIKLLRDELELSMALCGCERLEDIDASLIWRPKHN